MSENSEHKNGFLDKLSETQVAKAIFRTGIPRNRRQRMMIMLNNVFLASSSGTLAQTRREG